jgi:hypothetical protein
VTLEGLSGVGATARREPAKPTEERGQEEAVTVNEGQRQPDSDGWLLPVDVPRL